MGATGGVWWVGCPLHGRQWLGLGVPPPACGCPSPSGGRPLGPQARSVQPWPAGDSKLVFNCVGCSRAPAGRHRGQAGAALPGQALAPRLSGHRAAFKLPGWGAQGFLRRLQALALGHSEGWLSVRGGPAGSRTRVRVPWALSSGKAGGPREQADRWDLPDSPCNLTEATEAGVPDEEAESRVARGLPRPVAVEGKLGFESFSTDAGSAAQTGKGLVRLGPGSGWAARPRPRSPRAAELGVGPQPSWFRIHMLHPVPLTCPAAPRPPEEAAPAMSLLLCGALTGSGFGRRPPPPPPRPAHFLP